MICCWITPTAIQLFKVPLSYFKTNGGIETVPNLAIIGMPYLPKGMPNLKEWCIVFFVDSWVFIIWLVVSTPLKNGGVRQMGLLFPIYGKS